MVPAASLRSITAHDLMGRGLRQGLEKNLGDPGEELRGINIPGFRAS